MFLYMRQTLFAAWASLAVMIEPMSGGSGIPEVKCFLNGIDLPRINDLKTGICKVLGVIGSVAAGLPVGKEGPMVHSGAVVASAVSKGRVKDDKKRRDYVACGAAAGVCTAFSAPIGGFLFAFEEGASYWSQSLTFRTFYTSGCAIATLYFLNSIGLAFGKVGFNKLFSFGNFVFEGTATSYATWELLVFVFIGCMGGLIGAIFNDANERITRWRIKHVNDVKSYRFLEVLCVSSLVTLMMFGLPFMFQECLPSPDAADSNDQQRELIDSLHQFSCEDGHFNPLASLLLTDGNDAIKLLFHMHSRTFPLYTLILFFTFYISLATLTYGIAVPSGLFVPSLLSGAAFGRLLGNVIYELNPESGVAFSNVYALVGAAAVLGGMARMTISLTVSWLALNRYLDNIERLNICVL
jgi:H+/Cl- antiporter ClcA